jgi:putative transcriptional regulator
MFTLSANSQQLATGKVLVATKKSHDPDFARSIVLLIHYDSEAAIGLMLNKPTAVPISDILPEVKGKSITIYAGGPIAIGVRGLLQSKARPFFTVISGKTEILRIVSSGVPPDSFRLYAGYTGWTARQLQSEVARGLWKVLLANPDTPWRRTEQLPGLTPPRPIR